MPDTNPAYAVWIAAMELLRDEGSLSESQAAFIRMAKPIACVDGAFMVAVSSDFVKNWLETKVAASMIEKINQILGFPQRLEISVDPGVATTDSAAASTTPSVETPSAVNKPTPAAPVAPEPVAEPSVQAPVEVPAMQTEERPANPANPTHPATAEPAAPAAAPATPAATSAPVATPYVHISEDYLDDSDDLDVLDDTYIADESKKKSYLPPDDPRVLEAHINPKYTLDNFVVGESNHFAHALAVGAAESIDNHYNPLFFYSKSGMGKTHLLHGIGYYALSFFPEKKVLYISAEEFLSDFITAIRDKRQNEFKQRYRNIDILLIDDIEFIGQSEQTIKEFFYTFDALLLANKQIVITSDEPPSELHDFPERMTSRFASGYTVEINMPPIETRIAILERKTQAENVVLPREVLEYIAANITSNIREMEGALRRVIAYSSLYSSGDYSLSNIEPLLKDLISENDHVEITAYMIMNCVASYFTVSVDDILSPNRARNVSAARQMAFYLCREMTDLSLPKIGELFNRDHTTVMYAVKKISDDMAKKQNIYNTVMELTSRIKRTSQNQEI